MFKRAKKELAKQTIATEEFAASDDEEQYLGASSDSDMDDDLNSVGGLDSEGDEDDIEDSVDLKEIIRQKAEESGEDDLDLDNEDALKKLIEEEGLADLDDLEDLEDEGSEDENDDEENQGSAEEAEGSAADDEEEDEDEGDMIYSCKICPHRILKNEKAVEVHLQGKVMSYDGKTTLQFF
jgi:hypothetical protein